MNTSFSCYIMISWQQASLCNVEHLFGAINKIVIFNTFVPYFNCALIFYLIEVD